MMQFTLSSTIAYTSKEGIQNVTNSALAAGIGVATRRMIYRSSENVAMSTSNAVHSLNMVWRSCRDFDKRNLFVWTTYLRASQRSFISK
jgi:hypothetical protein